MTGALFYADLHVHSRHARATSRDLDLEHMARAAACKGVSVLGTGDCVHPAWRAELAEKLVPDGHGLYRLRAPFARAASDGLPPSCGADIRFMVSVEISTIRARGGRTRRVHHLVYLPDLDAASRLAARLAAIGNIASDGRPILGLDPRDLLEIVLETDDDATLVPAHVWTPWFSALGARGGFDSIEECYGDLAPHVHALETGLSADPAMIRLVSALDRFRLMSSSDAHSPRTVGREATMFSCARSFAAIRAAIETGRGLEGTVEFFPEEGKYHADGHRGCGVRLSPAETRAAGGHCPVCGGRIVTGVAHRVEELADREAPAMQERATHLVPLVEILAEIEGRGAATKTVAREEARVRAALGPELPLLASVPLAVIARHDARLAEAVRRLRAGEVFRDAGYDGTYGTIRLFAPGELGTARAA